MCFDENRRCANVFNPKIDVDAILFSSNSCVTKRRIKWGICFSGSDNLSFVEITSNTDTYQNIKKNNSYPFVIAMQTSKQGASLMKWKFDNVRFEDAKAARSLKQSQGSLMFKFNLEKPLSPQKQKLPNVQEQKDKERKVHDSMKSTLTPSTFSNQQQHLPLEQVYEDMFKNLYGSEYNSMVLKQRTSARQKDRRLEIRIADLLN